ncbi:BREX-3 system P-loop-containing protein BrxF [Pacificimonas flava]|uniref:Uncharacterized protein n=1 Tax=Pacificimonas flava TaxID=1234595 RepID=M2U2A4_9SPHN|nr:BREX-3 system P-loop-containing protein BrxF [Pacificimonas flava]EMD81933.1 hypothetical protein C725_2722 [Pacificimonas flava]MBB5281535.1 hypothetical protein [Pacificimonas flava]
MTGNLTFEIMTASATACAAGKCCLLVGECDRRDHALHTVSASEGCEVTNVSRLLADIMLAGGTPTPRAFSNALPGDGTTLLSHIELLFLPSLQLDPVDFLARLARTRPVCASWPGTYASGRLRYAGAEHPECFDSDDQKAIIVDLNQRKDA